MFNRITIIGNMGRDPEVRTTDFGRVVTFSLATSESWKDKNTGERKERTQWHNVVVFNEQIGKVAEDYLRKGSKALVEGSLEYREYVDKEGITRKVAEVVLRPFQGTLKLFGDSQAARRSPDDYGQTSTRKSAPAQHAAAAPIDDDIPF